MLRRVLTNWRRRYSYQFGLCTAILVMASIYVISMEAPPESEIARPESLFLATEAAKVAIQKDWTHGKYQLSESALPSWMKAYVAFHKRHVQTPASASRLVWHCPENRGCGGIGDRLSGIVQALMMSMVTKRVFLVDWHGSSLSINKVLRPRFIAWDSIPLPQDMEKVYANDYRNNVILRDPRTLPQKVNIQLQANLCLYDAVLEREPAYLAYWNHYGGVNISQSSPFKISFWTLFQWTDLVVRHAQGLRNAAGLTEAAHRYIGVHVRTGSGVSWTDPPRHAGLPALRQFYHCAKRLQQALHQKCVNVSDSTSSLPEIYLAADRVDAKIHMKAWDSEDDNTIKFVKNLEPFHVDKSRNEMNTSAAELDVWGELKVLLDATCLVTSRSQFSTLASSLRMDQTPHRCAVMFDQCDTEQIKRAVAVVSSC
jgi:hypothetical protein